MFLQTTPTGGAGSATSPVTYLVLAGLAVWLLQTQTGFDPVGRVRGLLGGGDSSSGGGRVLNPSPGFGLGRTRTLLIVAVAVLVVAVFAGAFALPSDVRVPVAAVGVLLATYLVLRGLGSYSATTFAIVGGGVVILGLSALGEPLIGALAQSPVFPILGIGALYLGYQAIQAYRERNSGPQYVRIRRGER